MITLSRTKRPTNYMSKKRKTRKQKELAKTHTHNIQQLDIKEPTYSILDIKPTEKKVEKPTQTFENELSVEQKDIAYLKHDISAITAASGLILAFDILLFVLLTTGTFSLHFLGY